MAGVYYPAQHVLTGIQCALSGDDQLSARVTECPDREGYKIWIGHREADHSYLTHISNFYDIVSFVRTQGKEGTHPAYAERRIFRELLDVKDWDRISNRAREHYHGKGLVMEDGAPIPPGFAELTVTFYKAAIKSMIERSNKDWIPAGSVMQRFEQINAEYERKALQKAQEMELQRALSTADRQSYYMTQQGLKTADQIQELQRALQNHPYAPKRWTATTASGPIVMTPCECGRKFSGGLHSRWCPAFVEVK